MIKILFICHGNICRSPMAEFILKHLVNMAGLSEEFEIASAATSSDDAGSDIYHDAKKKLTEYRIPFEKRKARKIRKSDYGYYDLLVGMDEYNIRNILKITGPDKQNKIRFLKKDNKNIEDPWYTRDFEKAYRNIKDGCIRLLNDILKDKKFIKSAPAKVYSTVLCYMEKNGSYLMLHRTKKENDINEGKWIGIGGKIEEGESPGECLVREVKEETNLTLKTYSYRGIVTFVDTGIIEYMHLYTSDDFYGELSECDEGDLAWIEKKSVKSLDIWEGDKEILALIDEDIPFFSIRAVYENGVYKGSVKTDN